MRKRLRCLTAMTAAVMGAGMLLPLAACGGGDSDPLTIEFQFYGSQEEMAATRELVAEYNATNPDGITVEATGTATADYPTKIQNMLRGRNVSDVIMVKDEYIKSWVELGGIAALDEFVAESEVISVENLWEGGVNRFRYNTQTRRDSEGSLYGILNDYSTAVLYYNIDAMEQVGITCISVEREDCAAQGYPEEGFFEKDGTWYFNNRVPVTWNEEDGGALLTLLGLLTSNTDAMDGYRNNNSPTRYGCYFANWFPFGWSVGGDCLEWVEDDSLSTGGSYEFTLFDDTKNYRVPEGETLTVGAATYSAGEIVSYTDKALLTSEQKAALTELPSQLEALQFYVDLSVKYGVGAKPDLTTGSSSNKVFAAGNCAVVMGHRNSTGISRQIVEFDWDVAPLPVHEDGIETSFGMANAFCITEKSTKKEAAWKFIEYMCGQEGQEKYAATGFTLPNSPAIANSEAFLQSDQKPANSVVFVETAYYQRSGDWAWLPSKMWVSEWAEDLNNYVLAGDMTLAELKERRQESTQAIIDSYYAAT